MKIRKSLDVRLIAITMTCLLLPTMACPSQCTCKKEILQFSVSCTDVGLKSIPDHIDTQADVLDLTGNDLQVLEKETFYNNGLINLYRIILERCKLHTIDDQAFKGLARLYDINLSDNYLTTIPSSTFEYTLWRLNLTNNLITNVTTQSFENLSHLKVLDLANCKIESIERDAFSGLNQLRTLYLHGNRLSNYEGAKLFPKSMRIIQFKNNNWNCDCHLKDFRRWFMRFIVLHHTRAPLCSFPEHLKNRTLTSVTENDLICLP